MSREIKFRAWDKAKDKWIDGAYGFHILGENMLIGGLFHDYSIPDLNNIIVMQYTGLNDKNGKEIYEGDKLNNPNDASAFEIIEWNVLNGCWQLGENGFPIGKYRLSDFWEVIGNIYENPELLNKDV
ncbi:MAG: YopX family protein [Lutibacter sp.]|jgi:hypothetical protein